MFEHYSEFLSAVPFKVINFKDSLERVPQLDRKVEQLTKNLKALANLFSHFNEEEKIMNFKIDMDHLSDQNNTTIYAWMTKSLDMDDEKYTDLYKKIDETNRLSKREKNVILSNILSSGPKKIPNFKNNTESASTEDEKVEQLTKSLKALAKLFSYANQIGKAIDFDRHLSVNTDFSSFLAKNLGMDEEIVRALYEKIDQNSLLNEEKDTIFYNLLFSQDARIVNFKNSIEKASTEDEKVRQLTKNLKALTKLFSHANQQGKTIDFKIDMDRFLHWVTLSHGSERSSEWSINLWYLMTVHFRLSSLGSCFCGG